MVGHALRALIPEATFVSSKDCDLRNKGQTEGLFQDTQPSQVIHLAAKVGGIKANMEKMGDFYYENILINTNVLQAAKASGVEKVLSLMSTCVYPDKIQYPLKEKEIHLGEPHSSNFAYAYAKRMLDIQSRSYRKQYGCNFITAIPNNLFGENDNYHVEDAHVIPALMHKILLAKQNNTSVELWGDGSALREFTYAHDLGRIILFLLERYDSPDPINIGSTYEYSIKEVAEMISSYIGYEGEIMWNTDMPMGQFRKPSDSAKLDTLGWSQSDYTSFSTALQNSCEWFLKNYPNVRGVK